MVDLEWWVEKAQFVVVVVAERATEAVGAALNQLNGAEGGSVRKRDGWWELPGRLLLLSREAGWG